MMKMKKLVLGIAAAGVLLVGLGQTNAIARVLGRIYGNSLHVENEPRSSTAGNFTLGNNDAYIKGKLEVDGAAYLDGNLAVAGTITQAGQSYSVIVATETIVAASTITANACGGLKRITSASDVTTDTTLTFTRPSSSLAGCSMLVVNVGEATIYLDGNALFGVTSAASLPIGPKGSVLVWTDGSVWWHGAWTEY